MIFWGDVMLDQRCGQRGFALITALLLLVIVLMLSLSGMQGSRTQESMAGNYRATERALMAAEYGAAAISNVVLGEEFEGGTLQELFSAFEDFVRYEISVGEAGGYPSEENLPAGYLKVGGDNAYLRFSIGAVRSGEVTLVSVGEVYSGTPGGAESQVVARRDIEFSFEIDIGYPSAINMMCPVDYFMPSTPSGVTTDELPVVDSNSRIRSAVAAGSLAGAIKMTGKVLGVEIDVSSMTQSELEEIETITGSNPNYVAKKVKLGGIYSFHAGKYVEGGGVDYTNECKVSNNPMCGVIGGVSEEVGAPPLTDPRTFHDFMSSIFSLDSGEVDNVVHIDASEFSPSLVQPGMINIITSGRHHILVASEDGYASETIKGYPIVFGASVDHDEDGVLAGFSLDVARGYDIQQGELFTLPSSPSFPFYTLGYFDDDFGLVGEVSELAKSSAYFPSDYQVLPVGEWGDFSSIADVFDFVRFEGLSLVEEGWGYEDFYSSFESAIDPPVFQDGSGDFGKGDRPTVVDFGENFVLSEPTLVVVDGNLKIGTRPRFNGVFIVMGDYSGSGGGDPGESYVKGSIIAAPYYFSSSEGEMVCQDAGFRVQGAGNFKAEFDKEVVDDVLNMLPPEVLLKWLGDRAVTPRLSGWREPVVN